MLQKFAKYLKELNVSENTLRGYVKDVEHAIEKGIINEELTELKMTRIRDLNVAPATMHRVRAAIRKYAKFLVTWGTLDHIPGVIDALELPKNPTKIPRITTPEQVMKLAQKTSCVETKVVLSLLGTLGCRISSLVSMDVEDIKEEEICYVAKGNKRCASYLPKQLKDLLLLYLNGRSSGPIFVNSNDERMKVNNLRMRLQRSLGEDYINPHSIRHGLATNLLENNVDLYDIKEVLKHENIGTTQRYIHMSSKSVADRIRGKHPWLR